MLNNLRQSINSLREKNQLINTYMEAYYDESVGKDYLDFFVRIINKLVNGERSSIFITDMENETVWLEVGTGIERKKITVPKDGSMVGRVISSGKAEINNNIAAQEGTHKEVDSLTRYSTRNAICVPVKSLDRKRVTGAIQVLNKENEGSFNENDQKWLEDIAHNIQLNIEHAYLRQETQSVVDKALKTFGQLGMILVATIFVSMAGLALGSVFLSGLLSKW